MNEQIEIYVQYSENDFIRGMKFARDRTKGSRLNTLLSIVSPLVGYALIYFLVLRSDGPWGLDDLAALGLAALIAVPLGFVLRNVSLFSDFSFSRLYQSSPLFKEKYHIVFDDKGIQATSESFDSVVRWGAVSEATESVDDLFFFTGPHQPLFIPKQAFTTEQVNDLRNLAIRILGARATFLQ